MKNWLLFALPFGSLLLVVQAENDESDMTVSATDLYEGLDIEYDPQYYDDLYDLDEYYADSYLAGDESMESFGYGAEDFDAYGLGGEDSYSYYGDELDDFYDQYGFDADEYGYDYFDSEALLEDCTEDDEGKAVTKDPLCDVEISGVDKISPNLAGAIDGVYKVSGCSDGLPKYKREGKTANDTRLLWYSRIYEDWDISIGEEVLLEDHPLMYGASGADEENPNDARPHFLPENGWLINADPSNPGVNYKTINATVKCVGEHIEKPDPPKERKPSQPLLTDDDSDDVYRSIYAQHGQADGDPSINFTLVILMVLLGSSVVMGVPYMLQSKRANGKTLAQSLEEARKVRGGHTN